jgi:hypothetical protein
VGKSLEAFTVMRRAVLDCCGVDPLAELPGAFELVRAAVEAGKLELLSTHVLAEEIQATGDPIKRAKLQALVDLARMVPTGAFILGTSELDEARLTRGTVIVDALQDGNPAKNTIDTLIGITGYVEHCALITSDVRLRKCAIELDIEVLHARELLTELGYTAAP